MQELNDVFASFHMGHLKGPCVFQLVGWDERELDVQTLRGRDEGEGQRVAQLQEGHLRLAGGHRVAEDHLRPWGNS